MAKEVNVKIKVDTKEVDKKASKLNSTLDGLRENITSVREGFGSGFVKAGKLGKKGLKSISTGIKGLGNSIKAALGPLALIFAAFTIIRDILLKQQPILDAVDLVMNTINATINILVNSIGDMIDAMKSANNIWEVFAATQKLTISGGFKAAKSLRDLTKAAEVSAAKQAGLDAKNEASMERQRQLRDDELNSIEDRKKASDELAIVIEKAHKSKLANIKLQIAAATALVAVEGTDDNKNALLERQGELQQILADKAGQISEHQASQLSLIKEQIELTNILNEGGLERTLIAKQQLIALEDNDEKKRKMERQFIIFEKALRLEALNNQLSTLKNGTIAHANVLQAKLNLEQAQNNKLVLFDRETAAKRKVIDDKIITDKKKALDAQNKQGEADAKRYATEAKKEEDAANALSQFRLDLAAAEAIKLEAIRDTEINAAEFRAAILLNNEELNADERKLIEEKLAKEKGIINDKYIKDKATADAEAIAKEKLESSEKLQTQLDNAQSALDTAQVLSDAISAISDLRHQNEQDDLNERFASDSAALDAKAADEMRTNGELSENTIKERNRLDNAKINAQNQLDKAQNITAKKQFLVAKAFSIANIGLSTAAAIMASLVVTPAPAGIPIAVGLGVMGAAQAAAAAATKFSPTGGNTPNIPMPDFSTNNNSPTPDFEDSVGSQLFETDATQIGDQAGQNQVRAYVTERDITDTQNRISTFQERAELG